MKNDIVRQLMHGAYDLHIHSNPSPFGRLLSGLELAKQAAEAGMAGILIKSHYDSTAARASVIEEELNGIIHVYGGLALNWPAGGINAYAAENALKLGAKIIWMPTRDAANSLEFGNMPGDFFSRPGISIWKDERRDKISAAVYDVIDVVKKYGAYLATGHISPDEAIALCLAGRENGVKMILTHPEFSRTKISEDQQCKLASKGVVIEKCFYNIAEGECAADEMAHHIKAIGPDHCFMSTDRGQVGRERPVDAMEIFMETLMEHGITESEIRIMTHDVPETIVASSD